MKKKNILLILSDQQRLDTVSAYGGSICRTPHIDRLAEKGMKFTNCFTASPICSPTRASIFTGLYAHKNGVVDNYSDIYPEVSTLTDYLTEDNYFRGYAGKWHICDNISPKDYGFTGKSFMGYGLPGVGVFESLEFAGGPTNKGNDYKEFLKRTGHPLPDVSECFRGKNPAVRQEMYARFDGPIEASIEHYITEETLTLMDQAKEKNKPFFIWTNFWGPHSPSIVPEPYYSMYDPSDIEEHPSFRDTLETKPYGHRLTQKMWGLDDYSWDEGFAQIAARYFGHCTMIDDMVGKMVHKLEALGELDNTVIVYSSDHGDCLGAHGLIEKGAFPYEEIYRVPLVVYGLGGKDNGSPVYNHEIMQTIIDLAGEKPKHQLDGESLLPLINGEKPSNGRTATFGQFHRHFYNSDMRLIRNDRYTFVYNPSDRGELYDHVKDPYQLVNEIDNPDYTSIKKELSNQLHDELVRQKDPVAGWFKAVKDVY